MPTSTFQFGLRDALRVMVLLACSFAIAGAEQATWLDAVAAAATLLFAGGLVVEADDLSRARRQRTDLPVDARHGWQVASGWRRLLAGVIAVYWFGEYLRLSGMFDLSTRPWFQGLDVWRSVLPACLLFALMRRGNRRSETRSSTRWTRFAIYMTAAAIVMPYLLSRGVLHFLVHVAITGVELSQPSAIYAVSHAARAAAVLPLVCVATVVALLIPIHAACAWRQYQPSPNGKRPTPWLLIASLIAAVGCLGWIRFAGLARVSPFLAANQFSQDVPAWVLSAFLTMVAAGVLAYRAVSDCQAEQPAVYWRLRPIGYLHHCRGVLLVLIVVLTIQQATRGQAVYRFSPLAVVEDPTSVLYYAVIAALVSRLFRWRTSPFGGTPQPPSMPLPAFVRAWALMLVLVVVVCDSVAWASFSSWFVFLWIFP